MFARMAMMVLVATWASGKALTVPADSAGVVADERWASGVPLGGIGCGHIEVLTDGSLGGVTINNNWDRPIGWLKGALAAVWASEEGRAGEACLLRLASGDEYKQVANVRHVLYRGLWPEARVDFSDDRLPVRVSLRAWSSLIPRNVDDSALPAVIFDFVIGKNMRETVVSLLMTWPNILGFGGGGGQAWESYEGNRQQAWESGSLSGLRYVTAQKWSGRRANTLGDYLLAADMASFAAPGVYRSVEVMRLWDAGAETPAWWAEFARSGRLPPSQGGGAKRPAGAVLVRLHIPAHTDTARQRFILAWYTPHLVTEHKRDVELSTRTEKPQGAELALDSRLDTRWTTNRAMRPGDAYQLDLAQPATVAGLRLESSRSPNDWPRGLRVTAADGGHWRLLAELTEQEAQAQQRGGSLEIFFAPATVQRLRLEQLGRTDYWWWSIHEIVLYGADGQPLSLAGARATAFLRDLGTKTVTEDAGHWYERRFGSAAEVADYVAVNAERLWAETDEWRQPVLRSSLPRWLKVKLLNDAFTMYAATVLTRDGRFSVLESPIDMGGALGTMDQRMAAHAVYTQMFPELDESELRLFAACQRADGRITHFCGNVHEVIGRPDVGYGITDWPDLSCSFIMQSLKLAFWRGDIGLLRDFWPSIRRALEWLQAADTDGDLIPEGGSTYDYEQLPKGAFVYSASAYLGALLAGEKAAQVLGDSEAAQEYRRRFQAVQRSVMSRLWNGEYFRKWAAPGGSRIENSFIAALAGDWLARLCGLQDTLPPGIAEAECRQLIARHMQPFYPVPPMEVTPEGFLATHACFFLQHEPYLGCELIYRGFVSEGLEVLQRNYQTVWVLNRDPWHQRLAYDAPSGFGGGLRSYMTCPTSWHVLNALTGASVNLVEGTLYLSPRLAAEHDSLHVPVYMGEWWGWVDWVPGQNLSLTVTKVFRPGLVVRAVAADGNAAPIPLPEPVTLAPGAKLDLSHFETNLRPLRQLREPSAAE